MDRGGRGSRRERAQAIQIGALLLFAILIINLSLFQVFVVPNQNSEIEFKHNQQVQEELKTARSLSTQSVATDSELSTSIRLAPQYPSRALFVNPGPPSGTLETVDRGNLVLRNVQPLNNETADAWPDSKTFPDRKALVYRPGYNVYDSAPTTVYGSSVLYNVYDDGRVRNRTGQTIVSGNRITLLSMGGSMGTTASGSETIEFQPTSAPTRRIPVVPDGTMQVQLETELPKSVWRDLLAGQIDEDGSDPDAYVQSLACSASNVDDPCGTLTLTFESGATYSLRMGRVGVGNNVQDEPEEYITKVDPTGSQVNLTEDGSRELTVEVRDAYNNPVSGVEVTVDEESGGGDVETGPQRTDAEGRATFTYAAEEGETTSDETVEFEIDGGSSGPNSPKEVRYEVTVAEAGSDDPEASYEIYWKDPASTPGEQVPGTDCGSGTPCGDRLSLTMEAPGTNGAPVGFGLDDAALGTFDPNLQATSGGTASTGFLPSEATGTTTLNTYSGGAKDTLAYESFLYSGFESGSFGENWESFNISGYREPRVEAVDVSDAQPPLFGPDFEPSSGDYVAVLDGDPPEGCTDTNFEPVDGDRPTNQGYCAGGLAVANDYNTTGSALVLVEYWTHKDDPEEDENVIDRDGSSVTDEPGENLLVQYKRANGDWETVDVVEPEDDTPQSRRVRLTEAAIHDDFGLRFVVDPDDGSDAWYLDDVKLYTIGDPGSTKGDIGEGVTPPPEIDADASNSVTSVEEGSTGTLDGSASSGSIAAYQWAISGSAPSGVSITDSDTSTPGATFDASGADVSSDTDVDVDLTITDNDGATDTDTVTVTIRDTDGGGTPQPGIVFADPNNGELSTVGTNGVVAQSAYGVNAITTTGPQSTDIAFGSEVEVPYYDGTVIGITNLNGDQRTLVDSNTYGPGLSDKRLAVGGVFVEKKGNSYQTGGGPFVYFVDGNGELVRVDGSGNTDVVTVDGTQVSAQSVAGTGDIDDDGTPELVYVNSNGKFEYVNNKQAGQDLKGETVRIEQVTLNTPNAVGAPADFDDDGIDELPYINGNKRIRYVNEDGSRTTFDTGAGNESPVGVFDIADDGTPEIIYVNGNDRLAYAGESSDGLVRDDGGNEIPANPGPGAS